MRLAFIAPIRHLEDISSLGSIAFFLGHLFEDPAYLHYFQKCKEEGKYTIIDNGVVEKGEPLPAEQLVELAARLKPSEIIGPDFRDDKDKTLEALESFIPLFKKECANIKLMGVVQGATFGEWIDCYKAITRMSVDVIGIPYRLAFGNPLDNPSSAFIWMRNRLRALTFIHSNMAGGREFHCLGWNTLDEVFRIAQMFPWVRSSDSTFLVTQSVKHGLFFRAGPVLYKSPTDSLDFNAFLTEEQIQTIKRNAYYVKAIVGDV